MSVPQRVNVYVDAKLRSKIEKLREATGDKVTDAELMRLGVRFLAMAMDGSDITAEMFIEANS